MFVVHKTVVVLHNICICKPNDIQCTLEIKPPIIDLSNTRSDIHGQGQHLSNFYRIPSEKPSCYSTKPGGGTMQA